MKQNNGLFATFGLAMILYVVFYMSVIAAILYVVWHFISKMW